MDVNLPAFPYGLIMAALCLPIALGMNLTVGVMRMVSFAHGELYMLGGLCTWLLVAKANLAFFSALPLSVLIVAGVGVLLVEQNARMAVAAGRPCLRAGNGQVRHLWDRCGGGVVYAYPEGIPRI